MFAVSAPNQAGEGESVQLSRYTMKEMRQLLQVKLLSFFA